MPAYFIGQMTIEDPAEYQIYEAKILETLKGTGCEFLVVDDNISIMEGDWPFDRTIVVRFECEEKARYWYHSDQYQAIIQHRHNAARGNLILATGLG